ncbi:MAG TPA: ribonuclease H-like domain-containing protein [Candidatus Eisenbacteria bacterium]|nr:ribonuclease H-like domain-containing protein [Candidatus Eisenbacteria bacterium]
MPPEDSPAPPSGQASSPTPSEVGVEAFLPGGEWHDDRGSVYVHERLRSDVERRRHHWGMLGEAPEKEADLRALGAVGLRHALFLDLETGGLSSSPVFLAGTMHWNGSDFVLRQYFARHYGEEATLLGALAEATRGFEFLVTFNGKSYDVPFLRDRGNVHRVRLTMPPRHVDLLHPARRRWKLELPDCRLQTLEYRVCRRRRVGDVPGDEVPGLYHDYVRHGDPYRLVPVFHHNLLDVTTMGDVLAALCR